MVVFLEPPQHPSSLEGLFTVNKRSHRTLASKSYAHPIRGDKQYHVTYASNQKLANTAGILSARQVGKDYPHCIALAAQRHQRGQMQNSSRPDFQGPSAHSQEGFSKRIRFLKRGQALRRARNHLGHQCTSCSAQMGTEPVGKAQFK